MVTCAAAVPARDDVSGATRCPCVRRANRAWFCRSMCRWRATSGTLVIGVAQMRASCRLRSSASHPVSILIAWDRKPPADAFSRLDTMLDSAFAAAMRSPRGAVGDPRIMCANAVATLWLRTNRANSMAFWSPKSCRMTLNVPSVSNNLASRASGQYYRAYPRASGHSQCASCPAHAEPSGRSRAVLPAVLGQLSRQRSGLAQGPASGTSRSPSGRWHAPSGLFAFDMAVVTSS